MTRFLFFILCVSFMSFASAQSQMTYVPDDNFEQELINLGLDSGPLNDTIPTSAIDTVDELLISNKGIFDLTGIEDFASLTKLDVSFNQLVSLDVSSNIYLYHLNCQYNQVLQGHLDLSNNTLLTYLKAKNNLLSSVTIGSDSIISYLNLQSNQISSIDLSNFSSLNYCHLSSNQLTSLDFSDADNVRYIYVNNNNLHTLNVSNGNNTTISAFSSTGNPNLQCIEVDDPSYSSVSFVWSEDIWSSYSTNCSLPGCTDPYACNYNPLAWIDDSSCVFPSDTNLTIIACDNYSTSTTTLTVSGFYYDTLVNQFGCDSIIGINLTINPSTTSTSTATSCDNYSWNGATYTASGTYTYSTTNSNGCDSTATLNLIINPSTTSVSSDAACYSYTWNSITYTSSGSYTYSTTNSNGCDSTATLNLTINPSTTSTTNITECDTYTWNGTTYTTSGTYTYSTTNSNGCDSTATLNLTINPSTTSTSSVTACDDYSWNGTIYTSTGAYTYSTTNSNGCDSTAILNLTINNSVSTSNSQSVCAGNSITVGNNTYTTSGTYTDVLTSVYGCDSTVTTILNVDPIGCTDSLGCNYDANAVCDDGSCVYPTTSTSTVTACDDYTWNGTTYDSSGTYYHTGINGSNNYSMSFDGAAEVIIPSFPTNNQNLTVSTWMKPDTYNWSASSFKNLLDTWYAGGSVPFRLGLKNGEIWFGHESHPSNNTGNFVTSPFTSTDWNNITGVREYINGVYIYSLYINGVLVNSITPTNPPNLSSPHTLALANNPNSGVAGNELYTGKMEDVHIWSTALTQSQIQNYMNCPPTGSEAGLLAYWNFEEGSGTTAYDQTANGNNGTINGATYNANVPSQSCNLTNTNGCDSTATLNLTINNSVSTSNSQSVCAGNSITVGNNTYTTSGTYTDVLTSVYGCDSTVTTTLSVDPIGCTDVTAVNYDVNAVCDDGSCTYCYAVADIGSDTITACDSALISTNPITNGTYLWNSLNILPISPTPAIGDFYQGGVVFWVDSNNTQGLVCDIYDLGTAEWGCYLSNISGADATSIGSGMQNTIDIVNANCSSQYGNSIAANTCYNSINSGYNDWYLPSIDELQQIYINKSVVNTIIQNNGGDILDAISFWSSSENTDLRSWAHEFHIANAVPSPILKWSYNSRVRAIRMFNVVNYSNNHTLVVTTSGWNYVTVTDSLGCSATDSVYVNIGTCGCTDLLAVNYNANATIDDGSCIPFIYGCTDSNMFNYNASANTDDGSCIPFVYGCTDSLAINYDALANTDDGGCYSCSISVNSFYNPPSNLQTCNGFIYITATSGSFPYTYIWSNGATSNSNSNLCDDVYIYTVIDANGCGFTDTIALTTRVGCTDPNAFNYDSTAIYDDGSCISYIYGCTDSTSINYYSNANVDDGSCTYCDISFNQFTIGSNSTGNCDGWIFINANSSFPPITYLLNNNSASSFSSGLCSGLYTITAQDAYCSIDSIFLIGQAIYGCTNSTSFNYNPNANVDDGSCVSIIYGCTDSTAYNYNASANTNDGSCIPVVLGCTDTSAANYNPLANIDDGSCSMCAGNFVNIQIITANYGSDIAWELVDATGTIVASGGCQSFPGACYNSNTTYDNWVCLPTGCYSLNLYDMLGDGWSGGVYNIVDVNGTTYAYGTLSTGSSSIITNIGIPFCSIPGCTDPTATNYNPLANTDDGSCYTTQCVEILPYNEDLELGPANPRITLSSASNASSSIDGYAAKDGNYGWHGEGGLAWGGNTPSSGQNAFNTKLDNIATMNICVDIDSGIYNSGDIYYLKFDLRQEYSYNANYSWFRVQADNTVISDDNGDAYFNPNTPTSDPWIGLTYDVTSYIAMGVFDFELQTCNKYGSNTAVGSGATSGDHGYVDNISIYKVIYGCTDSTMYNYNVLANTDNGTCEVYSYGCTDPTALNYDVLANTDDGSCLNCYATADIGSDTITSCDSVLISTNTITNGSYCWNYTNATNNVNTNYSLQFTGNGYVDFGPSNDIVPNTSYPLTISWKYIPNGNYLPSGGNEDFMFWRGVHNSSGDYQMFAYYDGNTLRMYGSGAGNGLQHNIDLISNPTWTDFTYVIDLNSSPNSILYVNGVFAASADVSYNMSGTPTGSFKIGQHSNSYNSGFMDEFMIFNTALTQQEIQSNINCLPSADESNLLRYWRFEEGSGWIVYDEVPNSTNNGNIINNIHWSSSVLPTLNCSLPSSVCSGSTNSMVVSNTGWNYLTVTDSLGCTATDSVYVSIIDVNITQNDTTICSGDSITLSNAYPGDIAGFTYGGSFNGSYYYLSNQAESWLNADSICYANGGHLATLTTLTEDNYVGALLPTNPEWWWIGLYQNQNNPSYSVMNPNSGWEWTTSEPLNYLGWYSSEPNLSGGPGYGSRNTLSFGQGWNAISGQTKQYVLEIVDNTNYLWSTGDATESITVSPSQTTTYYLTQSQNGVSCTDSVTVTVLPTTSDTSYITSCDDYTWNGTTYDSSGTYSYSSGGSNNHSMSFDFTGDNVTVPNISNINTGLGEYITVEFWMKWDGTSGVMPISFSYYSIYMHSGLIGFDGGTGASAMCSSAGLENSWNHIVAVCYDYGYNGLAFAPTMAYEKLYINGVEQTLNRNYNTCGGQDFNNFRISGWDVHSAHTFAGDISRVSLWNGELTQNEVNNLYSCPPSGNESNLVGYWDFEDNTDPSVTIDQSVNGNDGLITGATYDNTNPQPESCVSNLTNANGCDSTAILNLTINNSVFTSNSQSVCAGNSITVGNNTYITSGTYFDTLTNINGCDSIVTTILSIDPIGCTDITAVNYDVNAVCDDGSCTYCYAVADIGSDSITACDSVLISTNPITNGSYLWWGYSAYNNPLYYNEDFEGNVGSEWSTNQGIIGTDYYNSTYFLGDFSNNTVSLNLYNLPPHDSVRVEFDLYLLDSWDGGSDFWSLDINNTNIISTSFTNNCGSNYSQAYPQNYPASNPCYTGAALSSLPEYCSNGNLGSMYQISRTIYSTQSTLDIDFSANGLDIICDESWALDNVRVYLSTSATTNSTMVTTSGWNYVTVIDSLGCTATDSVYVHIDVCGCTDPTAFNYNPSATQDDGSCITTVYGCTDSSMYNYNPLANTDDGSCIPFVYGCMNSIAANYNSTANVDDGSCVFCDLSVTLYPTQNSSNTACNGVIFAVANSSNGPITYLWSNGSTQSNTLGLCSGTYTLTVTDAAGCWVSDSVVIGSAVVSGCTDMAAINYDPSATVDDGSCTYVSCGAITGVYMSDVIHDRARFNWNNMNSSTCQVDQIRFRYRAVGTNSWSTKTMGVPVGSGCNTSNTSKLVLGLSPSTTYEYDFKIWYCNASTVSWHANGSFTTLPLCDNVINIIPTPITTTKTQFCWDTVSTYAFVRLKYREDVPGSSFSNIGGMGVHSPTLCKDKNGLTPGLTYRVMWRTWCNPSGGPYRSPQWDGPVTWTQPTSIRVDELSSINSLEVYPNPSRDIFNVSFTSESKQSIEVRLVNLVGEIIFTENLENFEGEYTHSFNLEQYSKGIYLLELDTDNGIVNKKLILQ